jgi:hypothetical protein
MRSNGCPTNVRHMPPKPPDKNAFKPAKLKPPALGVLLSVMGRKLCCDDGGNAFFYVGLCCDDGGNAFSLDRLQSGLFFVQCRGQ